MAKSESVTQEWTLASVETGAMVDVTDVLAEDPTILLVHGIRAGVRLTIQGDAPFGGPRIIRMGSHRIAVDRRLAGSVRVTLAAAAEASTDRGTERP
jgi:Fe2+ transport system protein FeoA